MTLDPCKIPLQVESSGAICVENTRVTLDSVLYAFHEGASPEEIAERFPAISKCGVRDYCFLSAKSSEIDAYLEQRSAAAQRLRENIEARQETSDFRARLLARKSANGLS